MDERIENRHLRHITFGYSHLVMSLLYLLLIVGPVSILTSMLYANLIAQTISEINREGVMKLMVGHGAPLYHLPDNLSRPVTCSPNMRIMSFPARLVSDNSGSLEKLELGHHPSQPDL